MELDECLDDLLLGLNNLKSNAEFMGEQITYSNKQI